MKSCILWFRRDLRLRDNPALRAAFEKFDQIIPLFILSEDENPSWGLGGASKWWLHYSLLSLEKDLVGKGAKLIFRKGSSIEELRKIVSATKADSIYWNRLYEPETISRDKKIKEYFVEQGLEVNSFNSSLLLEPWNLENSSGRPFQVFTPFWKKLKSEYQRRESLAAPRKINSPKNVGSILLTQLGLLPKINWTEGLENKWKPGEKGAWSRLRSFSDQSIGLYNDKRDFPAIDATSQISAHLHFGEVSPSQVWEYFSNEAESGAISYDALESYLRQLVWREFSMHLLFHFPKTDRKPLREEFSNFPWKRKKKLLEHWQRGETGYPFVDAGMRELWHTGTMHNRVRMIVASFLVKHLLQPWQGGAKWFWDTLVDADLANNTMGWQWTAGCGADAAPYFRVFNPILQGEKFDSEGDYTRRWVPELSKLPKKWLHQPWEAPASVLESAGVELGKTYPKPIVRHSEARERALDAYEEMKAKRE